MVAVHGTGTSLGDPIEMAALSIDIGGDTGGDTGGGGDDTSSGGGGRLPVAEFRSI